MYLLLNFIPVFINMLLFPLALKYEFQDVWGSSSIYILRIPLNILIIPIYLLIVNIIAMVKKSKRTLPCSMLMCVVIILNSIITYIDWGLNTGLLWNPDSETVMVAIYVETVFPILIVLFGMLIFHIIRKLLARRNTSPKNANTKQL